MEKLDLLSQRIGGLTEGGGMDFAFPKGLLFALARDFFEDSEVKKNAIEKLQTQNAIQNEWGHSELGWERKPAYEDSTLHKREFLDYNPKTTLFSAHESGALFRSMDIETNEEMFAFVCYPDGGRGIDIFGETRFGDGIGDNAEDHINYYFRYYDESLQTLRLTDENLLSLLQENNFTDFIVNGIKTNWAI